MRRISTSINKHRETHKESTNARQYLHHQGDLGEETMHSIQSSDDGAANNSTDSEALRTLESEMGGENLGTEKDEHLPELGMATLFSKSAMIKERNAGIYNEVNQNIDRFIGCLLQP